MDKASAPGAGDSRFESWADQKSWGGRGEVQPGTGSSYLKDSPEKKPERSWPLGLWPTPQKINTPMEILCLGHKIS